MDGLRIGAVREMPKRTWITASTHTRTKEPHLKSFLQKSHKTPQRHAHGQHARAPGVETKRAQCNEGHRRHGAQRHRCQPRHGRPTHDKTKGAPCDTSSSEERIPLILIRSRREAIHTDRQPQTHGAITITHPQASMKTRARQQPHEKCGLLCARMPSNTGGQAGSPYTNTGTSARGEPVWLPDRPRIDRPTKTKTIKTAHKTRRARSR